MNNNREIDIDGLLCQLQNVNSALRDENRRLQSILITTQIVLDRIALQTINNEPSSAARLAQEALTAIKQQ